MECFGIMNRGEFLEKLIKDSGHTVMSLSKESGVPYTTIRSMIERNLKNASIDNVIKVTKVLGIKADDLTKEAYTEEDIIKIKEKNRLPELTAKDEKDIQKELQRIIDNLSTGTSYAAFDGRGIDEISEEDRELLIASLEQTLRLTKRLAKQNFTPKKYK